MRLLVQGNNAIRVLDPSTYAVRTLAGQPDGSSGGVDGVGTQACFNKPFGLALDAEGLLYVADSANNCIRKITPDSKNVETFAGSCGSSQADWVDGVGTLARFNSPEGVAFDSLRNAIVVADYKNNRIRSIDMDTREVTTVAGSGTGGTVDEFGTNAQFNGPTGVTADYQGGVYVIEQGGTLDAGALRFLDAGEPRLVSTLAGLTGTGTAGAWADGTGTFARFYGPRAIAMGDDHQMFIAGASPARAHAPLKRT
jgi:DNA-binding beta-propeller fold protein YncE